jgi:hypothetical protein
MILALVDYLELHSGLPVLTDHATRLTVISFQLVEDS